MCRGWLARSGRDGNRLSGSQRKRALRNPSPPALPASLGRMVTTFWPIGRDRRGESRPKAGSQPLTFGGTVVSPARSPLVVRYLPSSNEEAATREQQQEGWDKRAEVTEERDEKREMHETGCMRPEGEGPEERKQRNGNERANTGGIREKKTPTGMYRGMFGKRDHSTEDLRNTGAPNRWQAATNPNEAIQREGVGTSFPASRPARLAGRSRRRSS